MTSAKERAVEAGARAAIRDETFPHDVAGMVTARSLTKAIIRATFPIQAEELALWFDEQAAEAAAKSAEYRALADDPDDLLAPSENLEFAEGWADDAVNWHYYAAKLRARIQQMAEAL